MGDSLDLLEAFEELVVHLLIVSHSQRMEIGRNTPRSQCEYSDIGPAQFVSMKLTLISKEENPTHHAFSTACIYYSPKRSLNIVSL